MYIYPRVYTILESLVNKINWIHVNVHDCTNKSKYPPIKRIKNIDVKGYVDSNQEAISQKKVKIKFLVTHGNETISMKNLPSRFPFLHVNSNFIT